MRPDLHRLPLLVSMLALAFAAGCARDGNEGMDGEALSGRVEIDGSSTVFPITEAVAEAFQAEHRQARVTVGFSGTGGGFKRFCSGETDLSNASRPITPAERELCASNGVEFLELGVAWDGLSVVVNPSNDFATCLTMDELRSIWEPASTVATWSDIRPEMPADRILLYGPGTDSGTFDYFTEAVMGSSGASRADFQASEDDNILVRGVGGDAGALGYFGYAYYAENRERLKLVAIDGGAGCVLPSDDSIEDGSYPLARPIFIYVKRSALEQPTVREFARFFMENAPELVPLTGYHAMGAERYRENLALLGLAPR